MKLHIYIVKLLKDNRGGEEAARRGFSLTLIRIAADFCNVKSSAGKRRPNCQAAFSLRLKDLRSFNGLHAPRAHVARNCVAFCVDIAYFLNVCLESSPRPSLGVGNIVARRLSLAAYAAYSRHNKTPPWWKFAKNKCK